MNATDLAHSAHNDADPPETLSDIERSLWLALADRWHEAHELCQDLPDPAGAWVHAWLHRQEGDYGNACYWYARAGKPAPAADADLEAEWMAITRELV